MENVQGGKGVTATCLTTIKITGVTVKPGTVISTVLATAVAVAALTNERPVEREICECVREEPPVSEAIHAHYGGCLLPGVVITP